MPLCPCHSGLALEACCAPFHAGAPAPTAEALMRSRYAAYALGNAGYVIATTFAGGPQWQADEAAWTASIEAFSRGTQFVGLRIHPEDVEDHVTFTAALRQAGQDASFTERSRFVRVGNRWTYHSGRRLP